MERRSFLKTGLALAGGAPGLRAWVRDQGRHSPRPKGVIWLWMAGGMSQIDTFDPKPGMKTAGKLRAIDTAVEGVQFIECLPILASQMKHLALLRSMTTGEGAHDRATYLLHTGFPAVPGVDYPAIGTVVAHELGRKSFVLPKFVAIDPPPLPSSAVFGEDCRPFRLRNADDPIPNLRPLGDAAREKERVELLREQSAEFEKTHAGEEATRLREAADEAERLMRSPLLKAFDWKSEPAELRARYGDRFGINCLLARRLVEAGCPFVEIGLGGWDMRSDIFGNYRRVLPVVDAGLGTLVQDLAARGLMDSVLVVLATEFGRTPDYNAGNGRDHHANGFTVVLAGAGIRGGTVYGSTGADGKDCRDPVSPSQFAATIYAALGIDATKRFGVAPEPSRDTYVWPPAAPLREILR